MEANAGITAVERLEGKAGELWGVKTVEDQLFSPFLPPSSSLASHQALAEPLAVASQAEVRIGSWRLHSTSLGY